MRARLLLSATLMAALAPVAAAQDYQTQQQPAQPLPPQPQPAKPKPPTVTAPKPKPAAAPAPAKKPGPAVVTAPATPKARLLEKLGDWSVFIYEDAGGTGLLRGFRAKGHAAQSGDGKAHARGVLRHGLAKRGRPHRG